MNLRLVCILFFALSICLLFTASAVLADDSKLPAELPQTQALDQSALLPTQLDKTSGSSAAPITSDAPTTASDTLPIKYWGNSFSLKFHRPSCPFAKAMSAHHVMFFNFRKQAVDGGQVPCRYCLPPNWTVVRATILNPSALSKVPAP